jgi:hypothetical protein
MKGSEETADRTECSHQAVIEPDKDIPDHLRRHFSMIAI